MAKRGGFPGGAMPGNMANLMKQAQKMQSNNSSIPLPVFETVGTIGTPSSSPSSR